MKRHSPISFRCEYCGTVLMLPPSIASTRRTCGDAACRDARTRALATENFWAHVEKSIDGCWVWTAYRDDQGYGDASFIGAKFRAHRLAWMLSFGSLSEKAMVLHSCDNPPCVRPDHLFLGDAGINARDRVGKGRFLDIRAGENNAQSKLTAEQVRQIKASTERGIDLAQRFGVGRSAITSIRKGRTWIGV